jgi:hypothetical protein
METEHAEMFALAMTPEMTNRVTRTVNEVLQLLQDKTETAVEALIVLDATKRTLSTMHGIVLLSPIDDTTVGHT